MLIKNLKDICFSYGEILLLDHINLNIKYGERICLVGRNGTGKTTLMKIISGSVKADSGDIFNYGPSRIGYLKQSNPSDLSCDAFTFMCNEFGDLGKAILIYKKLEENSLNPHNFSKKEYEYFQKKFDIEKGWLVRNKIDNIISSMNIPKDIIIKKLSVGIQRKILLAKAIIRDPEILLLDEPTNHMDLHFISWLEKFLLESKKTIFFITHDRSIIRKLATRIIEIYKGKLISWECGYDEYLNRKKKYDIFDKRKDRLFDKKISTEKVWLRKGIKARRSRNKKRVKILEEMIQFSCKQKNKIDSSKIKIDNANKSGKLVLEVKNVCFSYQKNSVVKNLSFRMMQGDRIGIIGPNGCGKTTLIKLLLKHIQPDLGSIEHGTKLKIAYFDQIRMSINEDKSARENVFDGNDFFEINGKHRHAIGYLKDFLFSFSRSEVAAKFLSGGEKNRLLLAKIFKSPSNFLVFDEPTNDLDLETIELLEKLIIEYKGSILLVSHDRSFIENVVNKAIIFLKNGRIDVLNEGYYEYYSENKLENKSIPNKKLNSKKVLPQSKKNTKISYMEKRELEILPDKIDGFEKKHQELCRLMSSTEFYKQKKMEITNKKKELVKLEKTLELAYSRWEFLESIKINGK